jgi:hypothetical protein
VDVTNCQVFARKILRRFGDLTKEDIENVVLAISELYAHGKAKTVMRHGQLPRHSSYYYVDMEYC